MLLLMLLLNAEKNAEARAIEEREQKNFNPSNTPFAEERQKTSFQTPTLEAVQSFAGTFHKKATPQMTAQWFNEHGADPKWTERDWQKPFASWLANAIGKANRTPPP